jgi:hypothetical protein
MLLEVFFFKSIFSVYMNMYLDQDVYLPSGESLRVSGQPVNKYKFVNDHHCAFINNILQVNYLLGDRWCMQNQQNHKNIKDFSEFQQTYQAIEKMRSGKFFSFSIKKTCSMV